ncbi:MAG: trypsin-like peptidase domain-containing protein, partial [Clostridia bacterium]|nr:trypsin-like peptidase domain-containing protein [Clostridia bacterium]
MMNKKNFFRTLSLVLTLALVISLGTSLLQQDSVAGAESVTLSQNATVVTSPFTEAVQKVHGSVVGVNNYTMSSGYGSYGDFGFPFSFGFPFGYGYGGGYEDQEPKEMLTGSGSGVVVAQGYVLTNYHVVEDASRLEVVSGEETYEAVLAGSDESLDLAVLKVNGEFPIAPVVLGDSDVLNVGDWAICIGNPLSFTGTTTVGVISALNREITNSTTDIYGRRTDSVNLMIQTDAAINAGNSGGGMFNVAGELIGVPSMKYTGSYMSATSVEGIGMAIPINVAKPLIEDVLAGRTAEAQANNANNNSLTAAQKPRIGVTVANLDTSAPAVANGVLPMGAYIREVEAGSPAETAGLLPGDIVVEVDGTIIKNTTGMINILQSKQAGDTVAMKVYRVEGL